MIDESTFKIGKRIGEGQEGAIYRALDLNTGCIVAIKKIPIPKANKEKKERMEVSIL